MLEPVLVLLTSQAAIADAGAADAGTADMCATLRDLVSWLGSKALVPGLGCRALVLAPWAWFHGLVPGPAGCEGLVRMLMHMFSCCCMLVLVLLMLVLRLCQRVSTLSNGFQWVLTGSNGFFTG